MGTFVLVLYHCLRSLCCSAHLWAPYSLLEGYPSDKEPFWIILLPGHAKVQVYFPPEASSRVCDQLAVIV